MTFPVTAARRAITGAVAVSALAIAATTVAAPSLPSIRGTAGADRLVGTPGPDRVLGLAGDDVLLGGGGVDNLLGGNGDDLLIGGPSIDQLYGGNGNDELRGGPGHDALAGGAGRDTVSGGPGDDYVPARDGVADTVACGSGMDTVLADARDVVAADCERLELKLPLGTATTPVSVEFLGWASSNVRLAPLPSSVPAGAVPSGATLTACAASDRYLYAFIRADGLVARTGVRAVLSFPSGPVAVDLDSFRASENGIIGFYGPFRTDRLKTTEPAPNGPYSISLAVEAAGVYTPVLEASVQRACA